MEKMEESTEEMCLWVKVLQQGAGEEREKVETVFREGSWPNKPAFLVVFKKQSGRSFFSLSPPRRGYFPNVKLEESAKAQGGKHVGPHTELLKP